MATMMMQSVLLSSQERFLKCSHLSTLSLILFIVMTGRQLSYLHTIHFFMGKINGIRVLRLSLLFIISSIKVSMAQSFMKRLLVFHNISVQSSIGTAALTL